MKTGLNLLLKTHNMNQSQLAEKIGVSQSLVSQWATGKQEMTKETQNKIIETIKNVNTPTANTNEPNSFKATSISTHMPVNEDDNKDDNAIEKLPKKAVTLEGKIKECKRHCLETYGFEILVVKIKE